MMPCISFVIRSRGLGCKDILYKILWPESFGILLSGKSGTLPLEVKTNFVCDIETTKLQKNLLFRGSEIVGSLSGFHGLVSAGNVHPVFHRVFVHNMDLKVRSCGRK